MRTDLSVQNNVGFRASFYDNFFKKLPNKDVKNSAAYNKLGHTLASPHWNRLAIGIAAMSTQPAIDYFNPRVDRDTATTAALRTIAKICVCTAVGFAVRGSAYKLVEKYAHASAKQGSTLLTPEAVLKEKNLIKRANMLKIHKNALSTVTALSVMLFTNVFLDAPLTTMAANKLISQYYSGMNESGQRRAYGSKLA